MIIHSIIIKGIIIKDILLVIITISNRSQSAEITILSSPPLVLAGLLLSSLHHYHQFHHYHHCTMCCLVSMFSFQPNKLRHILKFMSWYIIQHIFFPDCSVGRKTWFSRKPWFSNSKFGISFLPILTAQKIMLLVPKNEKQYKF